MGGSVVVKIVVTVLALLVVSLAASWLLASWGTGHPHQGKVITFSR